MEFCTTTEMAKKWQISRRRVSKLCAEGRIEGAKQIGDRWLIPAEAKKPDDQRCHNDKNKEWIYSIDKGA